MANMKAREVLSGLRKKGFLQSEGDHSFFIFYVNGKKTSIRTKVSHGSSEIDDYLLKMMSLQVKLGKKEFMDLINCPLSQKEYLKILASQGYNFT